MGIKAIIDHYGIKGQVRSISLEEMEFKLLDGSVAVIQLSGEYPYSLSFRFPLGLWTAAKALKTAITADPVRFSDLLHQQDVFDAHIPIYSVNYKGEVVEQFCEKYGHGLLTHCGRLIDTTRQCLTREEAIESALVGAEINVTSIGDKLENLQNKLIEAEKTRAEAEAALDLLRSHFPVEGKATYARMKEHYGQKTHSKPC